MKPRVKFKATKINIKEIPVTISAFNIGIFVIAISMVLGVLFMLFIAIAAAVPRIVAIRAEEKAMIRVVYRADIMDSFCKSSEYHFKVKPPHFALDLEALKERTIRMIIGAYKNNKIVPI